MKNHTPRPEFPDVSFNEGYHRAQGRITRVNSYSKGFASLTVADRGTGRNIQVIGFFKDPKQGEEIHLEKLRYGKSDKYKRYAFYITRESLRVQPAQNAELKYDPATAQTKVRVAAMPTVQLPIDRAYLQRYLEEEVPGVGPAVSTQIVKAFDPEGERHLLDALDAGDANHIANVARLTGSVPRVLCNLWQEQPRFHRAMVSLRSMGLNKTQAKKALEKALSRINVNGLEEGGQYIQAVSRIAQHPYRLTMIDGIGFSTADTAARRMGLPDNSDQRIAAAAREAIHEASHSGDTMLPLWQLAENVAEMLDPGRKAQRSRSRKAADASPPGTANPDFDPVRIARVIWSIDETEGLVFPKGKSGAHDIVTTQRLAEAEKLIARSIVERLSHRPIKAIAAPPKERLEHLAGHTLHEKQIAAIGKALDSNVVVITGGPGSGKTTILKNLIAIFRENNLIVTQAAPTGMAARRQADATQHPSDTVHRMLGSKGFGQDFAHGPDNPLQTDVLVMDEGSMLDTVITSKVIGALKPDTRLIIVGDHDQLPSVGPGMVLGDLIASGIPPVARLTFTHRFSGPIAELARNIRDGIPRMPQEADPLKLRILKAEHKDDIARGVLDMVMELRDTGVKPEEMLVLTPKNDGATGVMTLNLQIQRLFNPEARHVGARIGSGNRRDAASGDLFNSPQEDSTRVIAGPGDRVMYRTNDKVLGLANGDTGTVLTVGRDRRTLTVDFGFDKPVTVPENALRNLDLAYVCTIHKSQGSEYRHLIMVLSPEHKIMMKRNLLYTGITRAKQQLILVGDEKILLNGVLQVQETQRRTMLQGFLREAMEAHKGQFVPDEERIKLPPLPDYRLDLRFAS